MRCNRDFCLARAVGLMVRPTPEYSDNLNPNLYDVILKLIYTTDVSDLWFEALRDK